MYLEFFKFKKSPFHITPDPDFLFLSPGHKEASASIFYGIQARKGFVAVTGEVGVGKTTILRSYLEGTDPEKIRTVYIFNATLSYDKLLKQICSELGIRSAGEDPDELIDTLLHHLIEEYKKDRNVVLIIDEAQNMPVETLERLRMLSNLETSQEKLIQLVLVGQPEFDAKLNLPELRQFKQRIAVRSRIAALTAEESLAYIHHRLMRASSFHNPVFTEKALKLIIKKAKGIPRTINILCDNALITAFGYQHKRVEEKIVKEVIGDFQEEQSRSGFNWKIVWRSAVVACLAVSFFVSVNLMSRSRIRATNKQRVGKTLPDRLPTDLKSGRSGSVGPRSVSRSKPAPAFSGMKLPQKTGGRKKGPPVAAVKPDARIAYKPEKTPAALGAKFTTKRVPRRKTGPALIGTRAAVVNSSKGDSAPAALTAPAAGRSKSFPQKAPESLRPPARYFPQRNTPLVSKGKPLPSLVVKKGDSVSELLFEAYGRVDEQMLRSFKNLNPQIKDINKISAGEKIFLPTETSSN